MAAVATIKNPLSPKETLIFYCTNDLHVGLLVQGEDPNDQPHPAPGKGTSSASEASAEAESEVECDPPVDDPSTKGILVNPSTFSTIVYKKLVIVCGIRRDKKICLISPGFSVLSGSVIPISQSLAACGNGDNHGWLYSIAKDPPELKEYSFSTKNTATVNDVFPLANTYLCAYYESSRRYCIYQGKKNLLYSVERPSGNTNTITNTSNAKPKTPMAVANQGVNAQLYYSDNSNNLLKITRDASGWKSSAIVQGAPQLADATQLSVLTSLDGTSNFVYYIFSEGEGKYQRYIDPVQST